MERWKILVMNTSRAINSIFHYAELFVKLETNSSSKYIIGIKYFRIFKPFNKTKVIQDLTLFIVQHFEMNSGLKINMSE